MITFCPWRLRPQWCLLSHTQVLVQSQPHSNVLLKILKCVKWINVWKKHTSGFFFLLWAHTYPFSFCFYFFIHFALNCFCCIVAKSCPTLCDPIDCKPPGSSVHRICQAGTLEWVAISFSRGSSWSKHQTHISCIAGGFFTAGPPGKPIALNTWLIIRKKIQGS